MSQVRYVIGHWHNGEWVHWDEWQDRERADDDLRDWQARARDPHNWYVLTIPEEES